MKDKAKPKVKFDEIEFEYWGELIKLEKKLTLIGVLKGEEAKAVTRSRKDGFSTHYDGTKGKERLEFYEEKEISRKVEKITEENGT